MQAPSPRKKLMFFCSSTILYVDISKNASTIYDICRKNN